MSGGSTELGESVRRLGGWLARLRWWVFALALLIVGVVRTGPLPIGPEWVGWLRNAGDSLPQPSEYLSSSVGPAAVMKVLGSPGSVTWWVLGAILWACVFAVPILILARKGVKGRLIAIGIAASPAFAVTVTMLGHYDLWIIAGSATVVLAKRWWWAAVGAVIAVSGNPEQAAPSAVAILLVALAWGNRRLALRGLAYLGLAVAAIVLVALWASAAGAPSRSGAFLQLIPLSVESFLGVWPLAIYAWLGPLWIVVLLAIAALPRWSSRLLAIAGVVLIPGLMSMTTLDGTRVFVAVGAGALVSMVALAMRGPWKEWEPAESSLAIAGAVMVLTPSVIIDTAGGIRLPYSDWMAQAKALRL